MTSVVDVHAHLEMPEFDPDRAETITRAKDAGVGFICTVGTQPDEWAKAASIANSNKIVYLSIGLHPHHSDLLTPQLERDIELFASHPKCIAIGETGLDFHYDNPSVDAQRRAFDFHIALAKRLKKPLMLHIRDAHDEAKAILADAGVSAIVHCFSGSREDALFYLERGYYLSFPGTVTFKKATNVHNVLGYVPLDRILTETDAPYISPEPFRGRRNEPAFVVNTLRRIAEIKGVSFEDAKRTVWVNTMNAFGLPFDSAPQIVYAIRNTLYINLTNRCSNSCVFCGKRRDYFVKGHALKLADEPSPEDVLNAMPADISNFDEVVFCGYGEPTIRLDALLHIARVLKIKGMKRIRLNTDGLVNIREERDVVGELAGVISAVSVSLNAGDETEYINICRPPFEGAFEAVKSFISKAKESGMDVTASAVMMPGVDAERVRVLAEDELGVKFRGRPYDELG